MARCARSRVADADRSGDRLRVDDRVASTSGAAPAAWKPHIRGVRVPTPRPRTRVTPPVGRDVAGIAHRQAVHVRGVAELVDDLERSRLLPLDADRVDRVDQRHRIVVGQLAGERRGSRRSCRRPARPWRRARCAWASLPVAIRPSGTNTTRRMPGAGGVRGREAEVFPVDAQTTALAPPRRPWRRPRHPAVLERAGGVGALDLEPDLASEQGRQRLGLDQRGASLAEGDHGIARGHRQPLARTRAITPRRVVGTARRRSIDSGITVTPPRPASRWSPRGRRRARGATPRWRSGPRRVLGG